MEIEYMVYALHEDGGAISIDWVIESLDNDPDEVLKCIYFTGFSGYALVLIELHNPDGCDGDPHE